MLRYMTAGESHGKGIVVILDGMPSGLMLEEKFINTELTRRMFGYGRGGRMGIEKDRVEIIGGVRKGNTIGSPVGMLIVNRDHKIDKLPDVTSPRPGHADLAGLQKYNLKDARDVLERASARETAGRVAAGAVAKLILREFDIKILSHVIKIGSVEARAGGLTFEKVLELTDESVSKVRCADKEAEKLMCEEIDKAKKDGDTLGGVFEVMAVGLPPGLGTYAQWDRRLDANLARALMSVPAVKAVEIGDGIECAGRKGSRAHDAIQYNSGEKRFTRASNNAGGTEGGVTNGEPLILKGYMKPIATLGDPLASVDINTKEESSAARERSDVTAVAAAGVVGEAVTALELASAFLEKFGGDSIEEIKRNYEGYLEQVRKI
ncbi:MAG: chorismate synthase [Candidatus Omnitrophica bacterium]|nr:chorismate synthase [Candidatus Omnitrophota bacterium]